MCESIPAPSASGVHSRCNLTLWLLLATEEVVEESGQSLSTQGSVDYPARVQAPILIARSTVNILSTPTSRVTDHYGCGLNCSMHCRFAIVLVALVATDQLAPQHCCIGPWLVVNIVCLASYCVTILAIRESVL